MAMTVAFAPFSVSAAEKEKIRRGPATVSRRLRAPPARGRRAAAADHPDDAGGTAALRHAAAAASVGRAGAAVGGLAAARQPPTGTHGRRRPRARPAARPSPAAAAAARAAASASATVTGRVDARNGALKDAYVYVDMAKGSSARGHTLEIKQKDKQFSPQTAVVQTGTNVVFPNMDSVFHNVFSTSGRNSFDLGSYRSGDTPRSVVLTTPGVVEVFCNIHSKMNANILVVPGPLYAKVGADGSYRIDNVPVGARRIVAWSPNAKPAQQKIEVAASGGQANFTLDVEAGEGAHEQAGAALRLLQRIVVTDDRALHRPITMTPGRTTASLICAVAALGAAAGAVIARRAQGTAAAAAVQRNQNEAAGVLDATQKALDGLERGLEIEVKNAAVDPAAEVGPRRRRRRRHDPGPVRERGLVGAVPRAGRRAGHGGTHAGGADGQGRSSGCRSPTSRCWNARRRRASRRGCWSATRAIVAAVVPVGGGRRGDSTYLMLAMPLEAQDLQRATGVAGHDLRRPARRLGRGQRPPADGPVGAGRQGGGRARARSGGDVARARRAGGAEAVALGAASIHGGAGARTRSRCCSASSRCCWAWWRSSSAAAARRSAQQTEQPGSRRRAGRASRFSARRG